MYIHHSEKQSSSLRNNDFLELNEYLKGNIRQRLAKRPPRSYFSLDYYGWNQPNNPDFINILKNDFNKNSEFDLRSAWGELMRIIQPALLEIINKEKITTVCVVPRAKIREIYTSHQLLFLSAIKQIIKNAQNIGYEIEDGTDYILRHTNTKTTHFHHKPEYSGDGKYPYPGITKSTCKISPKVREKKILLIDDIYTKTINIDEDCMQALFERGAKDVVLYTVARTIKKGF